MMVADEFRVLPWAPDPTEWCDPFGLYAETYWLPLLHPVGFVLGRRMVSLWLRHVAQKPDEPLCLSVAVLAPALGITDPRRGEYALRRAVNKLAYRKLARIRGDSVVEVRLRWPRISRISMSSLPSNMQQAEPEFWALDGSPARSGITLSL